MKMYSKEGTEMMDIASLDVVDGKVEVRGTMMGSMPATIHVESIGLAQLFMMLSVGKFFRLMGLFVQGLLRYWSGGEAKSQVVEDDKPTLPLPPRQNRR